MSSKTNGKHHNKSGAKQNLKIMKKRKDLSYFPNRLDELLYKNFYNCKSKSISYYLRPTSGEYSIWLDRKKVT